MKIKDQIRKLTASYSKYSSDVADKEAEKKVLKLKMHDIRY